EAIARHATRAGGIDASARRVTTVGPPSHLSVWPTDEETAFSGPSGPALSGDDVGDRVGDVLSIHGLAKLGPDALEHLGPVVPGELGRGRAGLDQRDADVLLGEFLAEGLAEGA